MGYLVATQFAERSRSLGVRSVDWTSAHSLIEALSSIVEWHRPQMLDVIWSAGKCGFGADNEALQAEHAVYSAVIEWLATLPFEVRVSLLSSAGGIYEDSGRVSVLSQIAPTRPYGHWKLRQEQLLQTLGLSHRVYRISSVYAPRNHGGRLGLINSILERSRLSQAVTIYAAETTLRDYVWGPDIARHVVERSVGKPGERIELLAYGSPISTGALLRLAQTITRRRIRAIYVDNGSNSNNIVFDDSLLPRLFRRTSVFEGLRLLHHRLEAP
jgi:nucleoside-diphosphate-sugar epimerase